MLTTNVAEAPSVTAVASAIDSSGAASPSLIVPVAVVPSLASVAFTGALSFTVNVSSASSTASSTVATVTVFAVSPAANVSVPLTDV